MCFVWIKGGCPFIISSFLSTSTFSLHLCPSSLHPLSTLLPIFTLLLFFHLLPLGTLLPLFTLLLLFNLLPLGTLLHVGTLLPPSTLFPLSTILSLSTLLSPSTLLPLYYLDVRMRRGGTSPLHRSTHFTQHNMFTNTTNDHNWYNSST